MKAGNCVSCLEESIVCACVRGDDEVLLQSRSEPNAKATSSFTHSVINMIGMLIGTLRMHGSSNFLDFPLITAVKVNWLP